MDIATLAELYGGLPQRVVTRAQELQRIAAVKKSLRIEATTPLACLVVACRGLQEPVDTKKLCRLLSVSHRTVEQHVRKILQAVDARSVIQVTPSSLCVRFGCAAITELVNRVFAQYQVVARSLARSTNGSQTSRFDPTDPVFAAACVYACSKCAQMRIDRAKLIAEVCANARAFDAIVTSIEAHCKDALNGASAVGKRPRKATAKVKEEEKREVDEPTTKRKLTPKTTTKAAQRANDVIKRAVEMQHEKEQDVERLEMDKLRQQAPQTTLTVDSERYQAWRRRVLAMRRQPKQVAEGEEKTSEPPVST
ncbi:hypothetical protein Poli38472_001480 [Pythium oligandrum]|uniref:ORC6 second cyclin-like domain-containing protein n=1 Tax=Pythium oligandrum TaxID=41045 RepID=A0A8K1CTL5_PYTOL|nr:hypothetical protein Poli38472_001480 [Pythium oligandrum]|eukprot:TMW69324.1 hypothetical protein Poli38472_001480 [Pythium oligandrum]